VPYKPPRKYSSEAEFLGVLWGGLGLIVGTFFLALIELASVGLGPCDTEDGHGARCDLVEGPAGSLSIFVPPGLIALGMFVAMTRKDWRWLAGFVLVAIVCTFAWTAYLRNGA
jgi:hypothetical protein